MFDGRLYKKQAREQLKKHWPEALLITLLIQVVSAIITTPQAIAQVNHGMHGTVYTFTPLILTTIVMLFAVTGILQIAATKYYLVLSESPGKAKFSVFLEALDMWSRGILGMLWMLLWTYLWSCLFLIPGIIKILSYSQMMFILADRPGVSVRKSMKISMAITKGYKGDILLLGLSFIGWLILLGAASWGASRLHIPFIPPQVLSALVSATGSICITPYMSAALANTYRFLKADALRRGIVTHEDFGFVEAAQDVQ